MCHQLERQEAMANKFLYTEKPLNQFALNTDSFTLLYQRRHKVSIWYRLLAGTNPSLFAPPLCVF